MLAYIQNCVKIDVEGVDGEVNKNRTARQLKYKYETIKRDLKREYTNNKNSWQPKSVEESELIKTITNVAEESLNNNNFIDTLNEVDIDPNNIEQKIEFESDSSNTNNEIEIDIKPPNNNQARNDFTPPVASIETSKIRDFKRKKISFNNRRKIILIRQNGHKRSTERKLTILMDETLKLLKNHNNLNSLKEDQLKEIHDVQMEILNAQKRQELLKEKYIEEEFKLKVSLSKLIVSNSSI